MASMSPSPLTVSTQNSAAPSTPAQSDGPALSQTAAPAPSEPGPSPSSAASPVQTASSGPQAVAPIPGAEAPVAAVALPSAASPPSVTAKSIGSLATWSEPSASADGTSAVRDAVRRLRRAHLSRLVRSVMIASVVVCVAGAASAAIRSASTGAPEVSHATRVTMRTREVAASFVTIHDDGDPPRAHVASKREVRHSGGHAHRSW
jgi:hypothetical protein